MNSLTRTSATTNTTTALGTPCQTPLPKWEDNVHSIWDENEVSFGDIDIDASDAKSSCMLAAIKRDHTPALEKNAASFEPFWDSNEASLDSIADESDAAAAAKIQLDFAMMFANEHNENEAEIAPAASESQQAIGVPVKAQRKYYNYNSKVCATCINRACTNQKCPISHMPTAHPHIALRAPLTTTVWRMPDLGARYG